MKSDFIAAVFAFFFLAVSLGGEAFFHPLPAVQYDSDKAALGNLLFHDPALSRDGTVSCANCHQLEEGGDDNLPVSVGIEGQTGEINAPTVLNAGLNFAQFWDGRAKDLHDQAKGPIENPIEMGFTVAEAVERLKETATYPDAFARIYPDGLTPASLLDAIAEFEKALVTPGSRFDRFLEGEKTALDAREREGLRLFKEQGCVACHNGVNIGGNLFQKMGVVLPYNNSGEARWLGRYNVTGDDEDRFYLKVPSLRNVALTAPYFHDGSVATLEEAVEKMAYYQLGRKLSENEVADLASFLRSLTGNRPRIYFLKIKEQTAFHSERLEVVESLSLAEYRIRRMMGTGYSHVDNDRAVALVTEMERLLASLRTGRETNVAQTGSKEALRLLDALDEESRALARGMERFKSLKAVVLNSLFYIHTLREELTANALAAPEGEKLEALQSVGRLLSRPDNAENFPTLTRLLEEIHYRGKDPAFQEILSLFRIHARLVLKNSGEIQEILGEERGEVFKKELSRFRTALVERYKKNLEQNQQGVTAGLVLVLTLMALLLFLFRQEERLKKALEELNAHLEERVEEEIGQRRRQEQLLVQQSKMAAMGEMVGMIAHQWRQPLNAVGLTIQDLEEAWEYGEIDGDYLRRSVDEAMEQVHFMSRTIDDFRLFFRKTDEKSVFDPEKAVEETLSLIRAQITGNHIKLVHDRGEPGLKVLGYPNEFKQALINVISNGKDAILEVREKHGKKGGRIHVSSRREGEGFLVAVQDDGGGIPEEVLERVFEPYFTTKEEGKGTGIGLYMCKVIIEDNMGGKVAAENRGDGALISLWLKMDEGKGAMPSDPAGT